MYIPTAFAETDAKKLHDFIAANSFGLLISTHQGEPFATHLPFLLERDAGPHGALAGHVARANPHWRDLDGQNVLAVFSGPHAYVSPSWYESDGVVPTWNYVAVHAYGVCRLVDDVDGLTRILKASVATYERLDAESLDVRRRRRLLPENGPGGRRLSHRDRAALKGSGS